MFPAHRNRKGWLVLHKFAEAGIILGLLLFNAILAYFHTSVTKKMVGILFLFIGLKSPYPTADNATSTLYWKRARHDWRFWVAVVFIFAAIAVYVVTVGLSLVPRRERTYHSWFFALSRPTLPLATSISTIG